MGSDIVCKLFYGKNNPRNSEGSFVTLKDGRILFVYSRYYGTSGSDHGSAELAARVSLDDGRTWSKKDRVVVENEGGWNVMSVSLLRLNDGRIAMFYLRKNSIKDCRPYMRASRDEGQTWSRPKLCVDAPGYFVLNNDRVVQLRNGRILMPVGYHRTRTVPGNRTQLGIDGRALFLTYYSDDGGRTWSEGSDCWTLPVRSRSGMQEPGVVELGNGHIYGWCRTSTGRQWETTSRDKGDTWTEPRPSRFHSPCSPMSIKRLPSTKDLLVVWNDASGRWDLPRKKLVEGWARDKSRGRTPLVSAISSNQGRTWRKAKLLETDPRRGFCYIAIHPVGDAVLLAYCCGGGKRGGMLQDMCIRRVTLDWLYE